MTKQNQQSIEQASVKNESISIGIDENMSDDEILSLLSQELEQTIALVDEKQSLQKEIALAKQAHQYLASIENPLLTPQSKAQKELLSQKLLFAMKKEKELQSIRQSFFQIQLLFAVAIVVLISCYSALWIQQNYQNKRLSNLHQIPALQKAKF